MRFEHIVLLIIAFNVVSAVLQRRAKKAREKALRESGGVPADPEDAWYEDEDEEEQPARRPARPEPAAARSSAPPDAGGPQRQPSFAQDILDQIMRDLGLKPNPVPPPSSPMPPRAEVPAPASRETTVRETMPRDARPERGDESASRERLERRERELEAESLRAREKIREWERLASSRTRFSGELRGEARPAPTIRPAAPAGARAPVSVQRASGAVTRPDLRDPRRLREAFVIKEILDAPLARRPRR